MAYWKVNGEALPTGSGTTVVLAPGRDEFLLFQLLIVGNLEWNINWVNVFLREYLCTEDETEYCLDQNYQKYWLFC